MADPLSLVTAGAGIAGGLISKLFAPHPQTPPPPAPAAVAPEGNSNTNKPAGGTIGSGTPSFLSDAAAVPGGPGSGAALGGKSMLGQ